MTSRRKLIEVALPLKAINTASAREKSIRHGHPSTLHLWWARRPLAAARAVIFAQMVDDPSSYPDLFPTEKAQEKERRRLFEIIEDLVQWENTKNEVVLDRARAEIWQSWRRACAENSGHPRAGELFDRKKLPAFHDPFAGGGSLPLEAQRLGLEAFASDLNPVAVLINKAMIEIPPTFSGRPSINPEARKKLDHSKSWRGAEGLAEDVRYYGEWMRDEAEKRIGHLYPKIKVTVEMAKGRPDLEPYVGKQCTVIAWIWARTVKSPNPAFSNVDVPLASTFTLSAKEGQEVYVEPVIEGGGYKFTLRVGRPSRVEEAKNGTKLARGANFRCLMSGTPIASEHIYGEANAGRMGARLMAIVAEGERGRIYLAPTREHEVVAGQAKPSWTPEAPMSENPRWFSPPLYGLKTYGDLFTARQLSAMTTFADMVTEARERIRHDAVAAGIPDDARPLNEGETGSTAYSDSVGVYLGFVVSSMADRMTTICTWDSGGPTWGTKTRNTFARQAIPMSWDFAEVNPFSTQSGSFGNSLDYTAKGVVWAGTVRGHVRQAEAGGQSMSDGRVVSTDPPYYDNIGYADLSDFFYVWLRRTQRSVYPDLFSTLTVPKAEELVATPYRHGGKEKAEAFFLNGMTEAMHRLVEQSHPAFPVTIYYAFKQAEKESAEGTASTGWETFLDAVIRAGFGITGTWPMRTELSNRMIGSGTNALASSIVLVCRRRHIDAASATRREFLTSLKAELPEALSHLQKGNIAPVDLAQAAIGPGMAVFSRYKKVVEADGSSMSVRAALILINQVLDEGLAEQENEFDRDSRWALAWFEQHGMAEGPYGDAELLSKAKDTGIAALEADGILEAKKGKVRLLRRKELAADWDPRTDSRPTVWEATQHLIRRLEDSGEEAAAELMREMGSISEVARDLAYRLYSICEKKKWAEDALSYNGLVAAWPELTRRAASGGRKKPEQQELLP
ncbi:MAG TPA: DUF1156 domain-containing protein [Thermoanaerobaculia bacterium]|nr:DUF1156 domain-containing protein [Thermoanaerobaculia bacterium]